MREKDRGKVEKGSTRDWTAMTFLLVGAILGFLLIVLSSFPAMAQPEERKEAKAVQASQTDSDAGRKIYEKRCLNCHGADGQGDGPAAEHLAPRPRDFTRGLYKIRSTPSGSFPTDQDLFETISKGMRGTAMPGWEDSLSEKERMQVIQYLKTFSKRFARLTEPPPPVSVGRSLSATQESIEKGRVLYRELECWKCHGEEGRSDGPSAPDLKDDWGFPIRPANLTKSWTFRGGNSPTDIYLRINTGLAGSPMPSFAESLDHEKSWHLANFVLSLSPPERPGVKAVLKAKKMTGEVPDRPDDPRWKEVESGVFPLVGQVIREPRLFAPSIDEISVKVVYNEREIAFRLSWDDPTESSPDPETGIFEDAVALQFPVEVPKGSKRPYFLMGAAGSPVTLWRFGTGTRTVRGLTATGIENQRLQDPGSQEVTGTAAYQHGQHTVVMKRVLKTPSMGKDIQFTVGKFIPIAFFAWDGSHGETGGRMALSHWYSLLLEQPVPLTVYVYPFGAILVTAGMEWWLVKRLRKKGGGQV